jgi:putative membrane protein
MGHPHVHWTFALGPLIAMAFGGFVYVRRFRAVRAEARGGRGAAARGVLVSRAASPLHALAFAASMLALLTALVSPVDGLGEDYLFSVHMVQHILLGDLAPLLLLLSLSRVIMRPATRRFSGLERRLGALASPPAFIALWLGLIYLWHIPAMYDLALNHPLAHAVEHVCFFSAGVAVWWPLIQPVPMRRRLTGLQPLMYIFAAKVGLAALGIYLAWSTGVAYDYYTHVPRIWGLSAIEDQNVGGAIMLVEQSLVLVVVMVVLFMRMLDQSEEDERRRERLEDAAPA